MGRFDELYRFFGMYSPLPKIRIAMYRKAGIRIGKLSEFGSNVWLDLNFRNMITIEDNVLLAGYTHILSHSFVLFGYEHEGFSPVTIKKGARIGTNVYILSGVTIGENSVVGAGAVVASNIPPNCLAAGVPAKIIKHFNSPPVPEPKVPLKPNMLYVVCKSCKKDFWSALICEKNVFETLAVQVNRHRCIHCHRENGYRKEDYFYK